MSEQHNMKMHSSESAETPTQIRNRKRINVMGDAILLDQRQLEAVLSLSVCTVNRWRRSGRLGPLPMSMGRQCIRWSKKEIEAWVAAGCPHRKQWQKMWKDGSLKRVG
jgi:predicted DNA-binding transcriptional regulator AlpA